MKNSLLKICTILSTLILWWYWLFVFRNKKIYTDIERTLAGQDMPEFKSSFMRFCYAMNFQHEFRANYYLRIGKIRFFRKLLFWFYPPDQTVMIHMPEHNIGKGLMLGQGFSIICVAKEIGERDGLHNPLGGPRARLHSRTRTPKVSVSHTTIPWSSPQ